MNGNPVSEDVYDFISLSAVDSNHPGQRCTGTSIDKNEEGMIMEGQYI